MARITTPVTKVFDGDTLEDSGTLTSTWVSTHEAARLQIWVALTSAGTPDTSVVVQMSPYESSDLNAITATTAYYEATTVSASLTATVMKKYDSSDCADLGQPARSVRLVMVATGSSAHMTVKAWILNKE